MTAHNLAIPGFLDYADALTRFCGENDMPCVNFSYAKPELYPRETDQYYFDLYHMVGEGSDIFSASFCKFFKAYLAGEDTSDWFYADRWAYFGSVSFITNCWIQTYFPEGEWNGAWAQSRPSGRRRGQRKRRARRVCGQLQPSARASRRNTASSCGMRRRARRPR